MDYATLIRQRRESLGWTQRTLAEKLKVTVPAIGNWEQGTRPPNLLSRLALSAVLDIPYRQIVPELKRPGVATAVIHDPALIALIEAIQTVPLARRPALLRALRVTVLAFRDTAPAAAQPETTPPP